MKNSLLLFLFVPVSFASFQKCESIESRQRMELSSEVRQLKREAFGDSIALVGERLDLTGKLNKTRRLFIIQDRFLLFNGLVGSHHCHLYDLETKEVIDFGEDGSETGQLLTCSSASYVQESDMIWIFDFIQQRLNGYSLERLLTGGDQTSFVKEITFELPAVMSPNWIGGDSIAHLVLNDARGRIFISDTTGKYIRTIGELPKKRNRKTPMSVHAEAYQADLFADPTAEVMVVAPRYTDHLSAYRFDGDLSFSFQGPDSFPVVGSIFEIEKEKHFATTQLTRKSYVDVYLSPEKIFLLYSGKSETMAPPSEPAPVWWISMGDEVFVTSIDGEPLQRFKLDRLMFDIAFDATNQRLFGLDYSNQEIISYQLPTP